MNKKIISGLVIAFLITVVAIGAVLRPRLKKTKPAIPPVSNEQVTPVGDEKQEVGPEGDVKDWKIYRNEKHGFQIKYPLNWAVKKCNNEHVAFDTSVSSLESVCSCQEGPCYPGLTFIEINKEEPSKTLIDQLIKGGFEPTAITISGHKAIRLQAQNPSLIHIFLERNDYTIEFTYQDSESDSKYLKIFNSMIESVEIQ